MATHTLNKTRTTPWEITKSGDTWVVGDKGRIIGADTGLFANDTISSATVRVEGIIDSTNGGGTSYGISLDAWDAVTTVGENGRILANKTAIYSYSLAGTVRVNNHGLLEGYYGIDASAVQNNLKINNTGRIFAENTGIYAYGTAARITNSGIIKAEYGMDVNPYSNGVDPLLAENATRIVNGGRIIGSDYSIDTDNVAVNIRNKGLLSGDVWMDEGNDVFNNRSGVLNGNLDGGDGDDVFNMVGGKLNGVLYGGDGNDVVTLSSPATVYVEAANEGFDTVRINGSYQLGANIENLTLLGKANHTGIGNSLDNAITGNRGNNALYGQGGFDILKGGAGNDRLDGGDGNGYLYGGSGNDILVGGDGVDYLDGGRGNDILTGGSAGDIFIFMSGRDTITDFQNGQDKIMADYVGFGITNFDDIAARAHDLNGNLVIDFTDTDRLIILNMQKSQLDMLDFEG